MITAGSYNLKMIRGTTFPVLTFEMQDDAGNPIPLPNHKVFAEVRKDSGGPVILDLQPVITDTTNGVVETKKFKDEETNAFVAGSYKWDLLIEDLTLDDKQKFIDGRFDIENKTTQSS